MVCLWGYSSTGMGAENEHINQQDSALPDLEFLEFLGQFETDSGQWIDPNSLLSEEFGELLDAASNSNSNNDVDSSSTPDTQSSN